MQFKQALFVPNISVYNKVITNVPQPAKRVDLSWQLTLQRVWESLVIADKGMVIPHIVRVIRLLFSLTVEEYQKTRVFE